MASSNVELARLGYEAALREDLEAVGKLLSADVRWHGGDPSAPGACLGRTQALEFMRRSRKRRGVGELLDIVDAGEKVVLITRPLARKGEAKLRANVTTFRDGKVIEMVHFANVDAALRAAGVRRPWPCAGVRPGAPAAGY